MSQQTLSLQDAKKLLPHLNETGKKIIFEKLGEDAFDFDPVRDINSLEDACAYNGSDIKNVIPWANPINADQRCVNAFAAFIEIYRAFNESKVPIWGPGTPYKYFPWVNMPVPSGVGLSFCVPGYDYSNSFVPARLTLLNQKHVKIIFDRFHQLMKDLFVYN